MEDLKRSGSEFESQLCDCLASNLAQGKDLCVNQRLKISPQLTALYQNEFTSPIQAKFQAFGIKDAEICAKQKVTEKSADVLMLKLNAACSAGKARALEISLRHWTEPSPNSCWHYKKIEADGCVTAGPCTESGAELGSLPIENPTGGLHRGPVRLCNKTLSAIHRIKDPGGQAAALSDPLTYFATNTFYPAGEYGFPNCHGTALALQTNYLEDLPLRGVEFRNSGTHSPRCEDEASRLRAELKSSKKIADLINKTKGVGITQMVYDRCEANDCGASDLYFDSCDDHQSQLFINITGICVKCWEKQIETHGIRKLSHSEGPDALQPGCFMNVADHTTTVVGRFGPMCYTYEATTPWGPPVLTVNTCLGLWSSFDRHYCPSTPLKFKLEADRSQDL